MRDLPGSLTAAGRQDAEGAVKTTEDLARYRVVIEATRPEVIVEIGTFSGKSALWFARTGRCPVVTVDVHAQVSDETRAASAELDVRYVVGDSRAASTGETVAAHVAGRDAMVVLDGDHSADTVSEEMTRYHRLVPVGGYMVVEDGIVRWMPEQQQPDGPYRGSPLDAIERWLEKTAGAWAVDTELEDLYDTTQFPSGWLRRIA
ncbi:MAG: CmcI family methyltransferase [Acidimicrobiales bacterium]